MITRAASSSLAVALAAFNAATAAPPPDDTRLLNNVESLKAGNAPTDANLARLETELADLWALDSSAPLDAEVVFSEVRDGVKIEGIYINGHNGPAGQDRIFFYFARPEDMDSMPGYIEITGGGGPGRAAWLANTNRCAVANVEWRASDDRFRSKWNGVSFDRMKSLDSSLRDNPAYRLVTGVRRVIDFMSQQPGIAPIGVGGGSMGGYYTLLTAGVDPRVAFGINELGAGHLGNTASRLGQFALTPAEMALWLRAFDPMSHAGNTKAAIFMNLSANDYFFWLGDAVANFDALAGPKRLCISANFNHNDGAFGREKRTAKGWIDHVADPTADYPELASLKFTDGAFSCQSSADVITATLYMSPGENVAWPARYWIEVPATRRGNDWSAALPAHLAGLAGQAFLVGSDAEGRSISTLPVAIPGQDPLGSGARLWPGNTITDSASGPAAWRQIGPNVRAGAPASVSGEEILRFGPAKGEAGRYSAVTGSVALSSGLLAAARGIRLEIEGNGEGTDLEISLVQNFGAASGQKEFPAIVRVSPGAQSIELHWGKFAGLQKPAAFDNLRIDANGAPVGLRSASLLNP